MPVTARELTRRHLEALVVARAIVAPDAAVILDRLDRAVVSPAVLALIEQLVDPDVEDLVHTATAGQREIADRAEAITLRQLVDYPLDTLLGLVNGLAARPVAAPAWERDLAQGSAA